MRSNFKTAKFASAIGFSAVLVGCGGGGSTPAVIDTSVVFASGFSSNALTSENGKLGRYAGGPVDGWGCADDGRSYCQGVKENATRYYAYYAYPTAGVQTDLYSGIYIQAPNISQDDIGTADTLTGVSAANKTKLNFKLGQNAEWHRGTEKNFGVMLTMSTRYGANCRIKLWQVVTAAAAADTAYSINLSDFRITQACDSGLTVAQVLANQTVVQMDFQANAGGARIAVTGSEARESANTSVTNDSNDGFTATTISLVAPINFN